MTDFHVASPDWNSISALKVIRPVEVTKNNSCTVVTDGGLATVSLHRFGMRLRIGDSRAESYGMLVSDPQGSPLEVDNQDGKSVISGSGLTLVVNHDPFSFELKEGDRIVQRSPTDGHFVRNFRLPPIAKVNEGWFLGLDLGSSEPVYGLGEKWGKLDKRGQIIRSFNHDALGVNAEISYKNTPFAWSPNGWGAFVHTAAPVTHSVGYAPWSQRAYGILVEEDSIDLFLFSGSGGADIIGAYTELTGRAPIPPLWSTGVILSKAYYKDAQELLDTAREVRKRNMPCDVITLDGRAWQDTDTRFAFEWDPSRYPNPKQVVDELKSMNFKICVWEYPLVSVKNPLFKKMEEKGWLIKSRKSGEAYRYQWDMSCFGEVLTPLPESGIVDFTHPEAYRFWRDSHKPMFDLGVDMIKADFGEQIEDDDMVAANGETGNVLHNVYTLLYNRCVYEAAELYCKSGPFLFSRSSWTGSQRYPSQWGGDPQADWGGLAGSLRGGISWGMSGAPYYATDVGGFYGDQRDSELYVRWIQASVFSAHMRLHGIGQREPWSYGERASNAAEEALKLRYRLIPYLRNAMRQASESGIPVQRSMVLAFPEDRAAWSFEDQFMFGDQILVAPCLEPGGKVEFYLPEGNWRHFPSGKSFIGGRVYSVELQLNEIAAFLPEGEELPLASDRCYIDAKEDEVEITGYWVAS